MFDISFGEMLLIGVVALIVLGPEKLPTVARTLGALIGRAQRFVASVKADIHQQADLTGLASLQQEVQNAATSFRQSLEGEIKEVESVMQEQAAAVRAAKEEAAATLDTARASFHAASSTVSEPDLFTSRVDDHPAEPDVPRETDHNENQLDLFDSRPANPVTTAAQKPE